MVEREFRDYSYRLHQIENLEQRRKTGGRLSVLYRVRVRTLARHFRRVWHRVVQRCPAADMDIDDVPRHGGDRQGAVYSACDARFPWHRACAEGMPGAEGEGRKG